MSEFPVLRLNSAGIFVTAFHRFHVWTLKTPGLHSKLSKASGLWCWFKRIHHYAIKFSKSSQANHFGHSRWIVCHKNIDIFMSKLGKSRSCSPQLSPAAKRSSPQLSQTSETPQPEKQSAFRPSAGFSWRPDPWQKNKQKSKRQLDASWSIYIYTSVTIQLLMAYYIHTYIYIYLYIYICDYVCVCKCIRFLTSQAGPTKRSLHSFLVAELTTAGVFSFHSGKFKEILLRHVKRSAEMEDVPGSPKNIERHDSYVALT